MLKGAVVLAALPLAGFTSQRRLSPVPADPFTLGVASGDPAPDGVVIWTRLAPRPLADDGLGGMPARAVDVEWEVAAYRRLADEHPDLVVHLGDYQYEYAATSPSNSGRFHVGLETVTLADYRQRYAQYKTDPDLQAAHAAAPWLAVFDDHEVANNWADEVRPDPTPRFSIDAPRRYRRTTRTCRCVESSVPNGIDMQLYRRVHWGALATFHMLDTRQYRTDQPCRRRVPVRLRRTVQSGCHADGHRPGTLAAQRVSGISGPMGPAWATSLLLPSGVDAGSGPRLQRRCPLALGGRSPREVRRPVLASGTTELVTTSISSGGDGSDTRDEITAVLPENPHIRYFNNRRGYVRTHVTPDELRAGFRVLPYVSRRGAPVRTGASFVVPDRVPGLHAMEAENR